MSRASTEELILAIDQGTTNSKAALISAMAASLLVVRHQSVFHPHALDGWSRTPTASGRACSRQWGLSGRRP